MMRPLTTSRLIHHVAHHSMKSGVSYLPASHWIPFSFGHILVTAQLMNQSNAALISMGMNPLARFLRRRRNATR